MSDADILYKYCMKNDLMFTYVETQFFINVTFRTRKNKVFFYAFDKDLKRQSRLTFNEKEYKNLEDALLDFDDMLLLEKEI